ncbi:SDR family oxidoreductase [Cytobacillus purgationiresistens]|uniref:3-oxoacyl-[acyl-carrier protein] reductase n=1 Tax=Cytobacillus purgationiresistens TaxID=863449 RepID=A0ABU0ATE6_9BACI|nr:SDR family oxidoreductase [Cytobacillus purgationiresistens]MDQ0273708.1 3-oxoacyl-[acyl-carrier protein] reductase [Cytobacillus purgationiresistens]
MKNKTALITGGSTGIGKKIAHKLAEQNVNLIINFRSSEREALQLCQELCEAYGTENVALQADISNVNDCEKLVDNSLRHFSSIDILIHNAGPYIHEKKLLTDYSIDEWQYLMNGNLNAVFFLSKQLIPAMRVNKWGRIITIGFDRAEAAPGWIYRAAYAAAKTGAASLTRSIALEEAGNGITANMVCPGDIIGDWKEGDIAVARECMDEQTPVGRPGTGEDVARLVAFLTEDCSDFITGSIIPVTGGKDVLSKNIGVP